MTVVGHRALAGGRVEATARTDPVVLVPVWTARFGLRARGRVLGCWPVLRCGGGRRRLGIDLGHLRGLRRRSGSRFRRRRCSHGERRFVRLLKPVLTQRLPVGLCLLGDPKRIGSRDNCVVAPGRGSRMLNRKQGKDHGAADTQPHTCHVARHFQVSLAQIPPQAQEAGGQQQSQGAGDVDDQQEERPMVRGAGRGNERGRA